jgi:beta-lactamase regulating signal transducer with metallopeptidase domain
MALELLLALARANLAAGAAILLVLILRRPARRLFGAEIAYALWALPPLVAIGSIAPPNYAEPDAVVSPVQGLLQAASHWAAEGALGRHASDLLVLWLAGAVAGLALVGWSQARFLRRAARGKAGPAMVGVIFPRLVVPADYHERFTPEEREIVRLHEREHVARRDLWTNALLACAQCLGWFNPLIHLAAPFLRFDQELACDAAVTARYSRARKRYAETMLKTQLGRTPVLGCAWAAAAAHPLEMRVAMLKRPALSGRRLMAGQILTATLSAAAAVGVWTAQPPLPKPPPHTRIDVTVPGPRFSVLLIKLSPPSRD